MLGWICWDHVKKARNASRPRRASVGGKTYPLSTTGVQKQKGDSAKCSYDRVGYASKSNKSIPLDASMACFALFLSGFTSAFLRIVLLLLPLLPLLAPRRRVACASVRLSDCALRLATRYYFNKHART